MRRCSTGMLVVWTLTAACGDSPHDPCAGVGCSGRGFCLVQDDLPQCSCLAGYHAVDLSCEPNDPTNPCLGVDCSGHGVCRNEGGAPVCSCETGWALDPMNPTRCVEAGGGDADADADADADGLEDTLEADADTVLGCGNGRCDLDETTATCPRDCPTIAEGFSCRTALGCMECCGDTPTCVDTCLEATAAVEQPFARAAEDCYLANCLTICSPGWSEACGDCLSSECGASWSACGNLPAGTDGCWTLTSCVWGCPDSRWTGTPTQCATDPGALCNDACHRTGDRDAESLSLELQQCRWANCDAECGTDPTSCQRCMDSACVAEQSTCQADG